MSESVPVWHQIDEFWATWDGGDTLPEVKWDFTPGTLEAILAAVKAGHYAVSVQCDHYCISVSAHRR